METLKWVCMYIYMYVCMYVYVAVYVHTYTHTYIHTCKKLERPFAEDVDDVSDDDDQVANSTYIQT
jgi:hypothetical protein